MSYSEQCFASYFYDDFLKQGKTRKQICEEYCIPYDVLKYHFNKLSKMSGLGGITFNLGVKLHHKVGGLMMTSSNYAHEPKEAYVCPLTGVVLSEEEQIGFIQGHFDANMRYYNNLDADDFASFVSTYTEETGFTQVKDLNSLLNNCGYYLLVLDNYKQLYVGASGDIKKRITQHWSRVIPSAQMISHALSIHYLPVDSFRALDTTRVYVLGLAEGRSEESLYSRIPVRYLSNHALFQLFPWEGEIPFNLEMKRVDGKPIVEFTGGNFSPEFRRKRSLERWKRNESVYNLLDPPYKHLLKGNYALLREVIQRTEAFLSRRSDSGVSQSKEVK